MIVLGSCWWTQYYFCWPLRGLISRRTVGNLLPTEYRPSFMVQHTEQAVGSQQRNALNFLESRARQREVDVATSPRQAAPIIKWMMTLNSILDTICADLLGLAARDVQIELPWLAMRGTQRFSLKCRTFAENWYWNPSSTCAGYWKVQDVCFDSRHCIFPPHFRLDVIVKHKALTVILELSKVKKLSKDLIWSTGILQNSFFEPTRKLLYDSSACWDLFLAVS